MMVAAIKTEETEAEASEVNAAFRGPQRYRHGDTMRIPSGGLWRRKTTGHLYRKEYQAYRSIRCNRVRYVPVDDGQVLFGTPQVLDAQFEHVADAATAEREAEEAREARERARALENVGEIKELMLRLIQADPSLTVKKAKAKSLEIIAALRSIA